MHVTLILVLLVTGISSQVQEKPTADEVFNRLPLGSYGIIVHYDIQRFCAGKAYSKYSQHLQFPMNQIKKANLPSILGEEYESVTSAKMVKSKVVNLKKKKGNQGGVSRIINNVGDQLWIFRYSALEPLMEEAISAGKIVPTGLTIDSRMVYKLNTPKNKDNYLYATVTNELLIAGRIDSLEAMVNAGTGLDLNILDDGYMAEVIDYIPGFGDFWVLMPVRYGPMEQLERYRSEGRSEEVLKKVESYIEHNPLFRIHSWTIDNKVYFKEI